MSLAQGSQVVTFSAELRRFELSGLYRQARQPVHLHVGHPVAL